MTETTNITDTIHQALHTPNKDILKRVPNLNPEDYSLLLYLVMGYELGKGKYFGLTFPLEDSTHMAELEALSNGYVEFRDGVVKMGVVNIENLEKILRAPYIKPRSIQIL